MISAAILFAIGGIVLAVNMTGMVKSIFKDEDGPLQSLESSVCRGLGLHIFSGMLMAAGGFGCLAGFIWFLVEKFAG